MISRLYEKVVEYIKRNYLYILFYIVIIVSVMYPLPYYIYTGGGIINVNDKIVMESNTTSNGSFNMCYVSEINATIPTYLLSYILPSWDLVAKSDVAASSKESSSDILLRDKIYLEQANQNAISTAYSYANSSYNVERQHLYVVYVDDSSNTDLKIGDDLLSIDGVDINTLEDISTYILEKEVGSIVSIDVLNQDKKYVRYATVGELENRKIIGIMALSIDDYETNPNISFNFSNSESGPSGGLMLSLAIYDRLVDYDLTGGLKISGTGTIDKDGNVGSIGGVKYKLKGAVDAKSDIFLVPNGENYSECVKLKEKYHYDINIIGVDTFEDAINELLRRENFKE